MTVRFTSIFFSTAWSSAGLAQLSAVVSWQRNTSLAPMLIVTSRVLRCVARYLRA